MECKNCGKEIKEGMDYCMECGAPIEEPAVITLTKDDLKAAKKKPETPVITGPFFDFSAYIGNLKSSISLFLAFLGAILLYLSSFSTWIWEQHADQKRSANIFDMGIKSNEMYIGKSIFLVFGIMVLITGLLMLVVSASSFIRPLKVFCSSDIKRTFLKALPIIIAVIIFILIWKNDAYVQSYNDIKNLINLAKNIGTDANYTGGRGAGPVLYIAGIVLYTLSALFNRKEN